MRCVDASASLVLALDGALTRWTALRLKRHVAGCEACAADAVRLREARDALRRELPRYTAPVDLVERLSARFASSTAPRPVDGRRRWLLAGAAGGCVATVMATTTLRFVREWREDGDIRREAVDAHVRATLGGALVQVASEDRHTVKPWLAARLDYAPPVIDVGGRGCALVGARLDVIDGRRVATLVYRYRAHMIDVFVWPESADRAATTATTIRGFNVREARGHDMAWLAVSDVNHDVLGALTDALTND